MFKSATLFALLNSKNTEIRRVPIEGEALTNLRGMFSNLFENYNRGKEEISFDGNYAIHEGDEELLVINDFDMQASVIDAIKNANSITDFNINELNNYANGDKPIKALFMGDIINEHDEENINIAFQLFSKSQCIASGKRLLVFNDNVYQSATNNALTINEYLTLIFSNGVLKFDKFFYAKQVFSLASYYKEATKDDVIDFANMNEISVLDTDSFVKNANTQQLKKRIAYIKDNQILETYTAETIQKKAVDFGVNIVIEDGKIVLSDDKEELKKTLYFLAEDTFKGAITDNDYETNSKKRAN